MEDTQITYTLTRWDGGIARKIVTGWMRDFGLSFYCCFTDLSNASVKTEREIGTGMQRMN